MRYHNITKDDMLNGDGLRVVLWVSGCTHHCPGCHNPITWNENDGLEFDKNAEQELWDALQKEYIDGITFSGGDPLHPSNRSEISRLSKKIKSLLPQKTIWLYTGFVWEDISSLPMMPYIDILVDGAFIQSQKDEQLLWRGSSNQRVINVHESLICGRVILHCQ